MVIDEWDANGNIDECVNFFRRAIVHPNGWLMEVEYGGTSFGLRYTFTYTTKNKSEHDNVRYHLGLEELSNVYSTYDVWFH